MIQKKHIVQNPKLTLGAVAALLMLAALDQTIVTTALPTIVTDLGKIEQLSWVVTIYLLTSTLSAPIYGSLGDTFGRKIMMQIAVIIFVSSSLLAAFANTMWWMLMARAVQGLGGGGLFVLAFTVVGDIVPSRERGKIQGLFAAVFGLSSILGPLAGGFFVDTLSWHWIFFINLPIGILALLILHYSFSARQSHAQVELDYLGAGLLSTSLGSMILFSNSLSNDMNLFAFSKVFLIILCIISTLVFLFIEQRAKNPILPLNLFSINNFRFYSLIGLLTGSILFSLLTFIPFYLQVSHGISPTNSGFQIVPLTIGIIFGTFVSGAIVTRTGKYKLLPFTGALVLFVGLLFMTQITSNSSSTEISILLFLVGVGLGPQLSITTAAVQNSAPRCQMGVATAGLTLFRQIGSSVGVATMTTIFVTKIQSELSSNQSMSALLNDNKINLQIIFILSEEQKMFFQNAFDDSLKLVLLINLGLSFLIILIALLVKEVPLKTSL